MRGDTHYRLLKSEAYDDGRIARVYCKLLGPELAICADAVFYAFGLIIFFSIVGSAMHLDWNGQVLLIAAGYFVAHWILYELGFHYFIARVLFGKRLDIAMSEDFIKIGGWLKYRTVPNQLLNFSYEIHPRAEGEAEREVRQNKVLRKRYRQSWRITMYNGEVKTVLGSVYKNEDLITGIIIRLQMMKSLISGTHTLRGG